MIQIQIINGPNLNLLGKREPELYGNLSFDDYFQELRKKYGNVALHYFQSNHEGDIIDKLHEVGFGYNGIVLNAGAYSHYSYAIADALKAISVPVIEVHISDIYARVNFWMKSDTSDNCLQIISGKGLEGYQMAIEELIKGQVSQ